MSPETKQFILNHIEEADAAIRGQAIEQPDAEDIWIELKKLEMTLRSGILPVKVTNV